MPQHDLIVIGAGPGGYVAAIRAAQLGMNVACIEKEPVLGGTCLRVGCIPSKALLDSSERFEQTQHDLGRHGIKVGSVSLDLAAMLKRKDEVVGALVKGIDGLFKKNKITRYLGTGRITAAPTGANPGKVVLEGKEKAELTGKYILIATGSVPSTIPGVVLDGNRIGTSTEALMYPEVPKHLVVIGAGVIGLELGSVWLRLGAKVTVLEYFDRVLAGMDSDLAKEALKVFKKQGFDFKLGVRVTGATAKGAVCTVTVDGQESVTCDRVLVAVGRKPNTEGLGLDSVGVKMGKRGDIEISDHFETSVPGIYAIGDVVRGAMLAHKAEEEGIACVERLATGHGHVNYDSIPGIVYTHPEIASVGKTEDQLKEKNIAYRAGKFAFMGNGRARAMDETTGFVKILADAKTDRVLGAHIIGPRAGDLIAEIATGIEFGASSEDIARACHAHPTLSEVVKEAALAVDNRSIHG